MPEGKIQAGNIVMVSILDPQGENPKLRPAVVVEVWDDGQILLAAITSKFDRSKLGEFDVAGIPFMNPPKRSNTGLNMDSIVQCDWIASVEAEDVKRIGVMPTPILVRIRKLVSEFLTRDP